MMRERGLDVGHSTVFRWVRRYAQEINKRVPPPSDDERRVLQARRDLYQGREGV